jgi:hypothetical protein
LNKATRPQCARPALRRTPARASSSTQQQEAAPSASSAKEAVEKGLEAFQTGKVDAALQLFLLAQSLRPSDDEARAACYNAACAQTRLRQWQPAVDSLTRAINDFDLKLTVALNDPDLEALRERREWLAALPELRGAAGRRCDGGPRLCSPLPGPRESFCPWLVLSCFQQLPG